MTWRSAIIGLILLAGCQSTKSGGARPIDRDPLYGAAPVTTSPLAGNPAVVSNPTTTGTLGTPTSNNQPLAQPTAASPAVLATGSYPPLSGGQDLRIGSPPPNSGNKILPRNQTPPGVVAVVTADPDYGKPHDGAPGVVPLDAAGQRPAATPVAALGGLEQALTAIAGYNPKWHKLENSGPGAWRFSCSIPDKQEPTKSRTYDAEGTTALSAVQTVLDQISRDK